jgi:hypothetical protein
MKAFAKFAASALLLVSTGAHAATATKAKTPTEHTPESIECSKQADAKGLHGSERRKFRAKCKKEFKGKATTTHATTPSPAPMPKSEAPPPKSP